MTAVWSVRDIGLTGLTHDTVCNQFSRADMRRLVSYIPQLQANFASDDVPYDDASGFNCTFGTAEAPLQPAAYLKAWADTIHAAGLHVIYRGNWNHWAGDYGQAKLSYNTNPAIPYESSGGLQAVLSGQDTTSYMGMTYQWILNHASVFQDGDIFEPFGEPQNNGIVDGPPGTSCNQVCQFPSTAVFNQWLNDFAQADQAAFQKIGKNVSSGWFGLAGSSYSYVTPEALAHAATYNIDHFTDSFASFTSQIQESYDEYKKPMVVEWGDIWDGGAEPATANTTDQYLGWLAQQPYIVGAEYWQLTGGNSDGPEAAVDFSTGKMTTAGEIVAKWFGAMAGPARAIAAAGIEYVQGTAQSETGTALTQHYSQMVTAGSLLVGVFRSPGRALVYDNRNGIWTQAVATGVLSIWYRANAKPGTTWVRLVAKDPGGGELRMGLAEYTGVARSHPLDGTACNQGPGSMVTTSSTKAIQAGELAFAGVGNGSNLISVIADSINGRLASPRVQLTGTSGTIAAEDVTSTTAGQQNASMIFSSDASWTACIATFKHA